MTKLSKSILKEIVKECIVEIFEESFFPGNSGLMESSNGKEELNHSFKQHHRRQKRVITNNQTNHSARSSLDNISYGHKDGQSIKNNSFENRINEVTKNITSDPIMSDIFKDTAKTTMQIQNSAESGRRVSGIVSGGDSATMVASQSDPMELFSESANKWATLAFSSPVNKWEKYPWS